MVWLDSSITAAAKNTAVKCTRRDSVFLQNKSRTGYKAMTHIFYHLLVVVSQVRPDLTSGDQFLRLSPGNVAHVACSYLVGGEQ